MSSPIKAILTAIHSRRDVYGNVYLAFRYTDCASGKTVQGTISGGESNIKAVIRAMGYEWSEVSYSVVELPIRQFNRETKTWGYAGCRPEDEIVPFIRTMLGVQ